MRVILAVLNAKYIHSSLAIRYLRQVCNGEADVSVRDYSINDNISNIVADIFNAQPDIVGFSCYIWNIEQTIKVAATIKKVLPELKIIFGGPEVSFASQHYLESYNFLDAVISGEGEETLKEYLQALNNNSSLENIDGFAYRIKQDIFINKPRRLFMSLDSIPFPYDETDFEELKNKIVYYESSRGCPFACSYCLSSTLKGVRYLAIERVEEDIKKFLDAGVKQVKFVDRTFNLSKEHAMRVWQIILNNQGSNTNYHFEIAADLLDDEMIELLKNFPPGLIQFEIGVQSTNIQTLEAVKRKSDIVKLSNNVLKLRENDNIHIHLDLIAGLPHENLHSFEKSFNDVYGLEPHNLQLGFLKVLKGTEMQRQAHDFGIITTTYPPYEVLKTNGFQYEDLLLLKEIEANLETYHNSRHFEFFLRYAFQKWEKGAFNFYKTFTEYSNYESKQKNSFTVKIKHLFDFVEKMWPQDISIQRDILALDLLSNQKRLNFDEWLNFDYEYVKQVTAAACKNPEFVARFLPGYEVKDWRNILKKFLIVPCNAKVAQILFKHLNAGIVIYDYSQVEEISGRILFRFHEFDITLLEV